MVASGNIISVNLSCCQFGTELAHSDNEEHPSP